MRPEDTREDQKGWARADRQSQHCRRTVLFSPEISAGLFEVGAQKYILALDRDITERKKTESPQGTEQMKTMENLQQGLPMR